MFIMLGDLERCGSNIYRANWLPVGQA